MAKIGWFVFTSTVAFLLTMMATSSDANWYHKRCGLYLTECSDNCHDKVFAEYSCRDDTEKFGRYCCAKGNRPWSCDSKSYCERKDNCNCKLDRNKDGWQCYDCPLSRGAKIAIGVVFAVIGIVIIAVLLCYFCAFCPWYTYRHPDVVMYPPPPPPPMYPPPPPPPPPVYMAPVPMYA